MTKKQSEYFVGRLKSEPLELWKCRGVDNYNNIELYKIIWRGPDYYEGLKVASEANRKAKPPPPPPKAPCPPKVDFLLARQEADQEKLRLWIEACKEKEP